MNKRSLNITAVVIAMVGLLPLPAWADYHYASHEGSNTPPYTSWATAADSIQKAIDASSPHDTVYISAGQWYETVATGEYDSVAIIGAGMDSTYWYSDTYHVPVLMIDYNCSVEGITFRHLPGWKALEARTYAGVRISNCRFISTGFAFMGSGGTTTVENCIFDSCQCAISIPISADTLYIENNLILNTINNGQAIDVQDVSYIKIRNNILINPPDLTIRINNFGIGAGDGPGIVENNIVSNLCTGISTSVTTLNNNTTNGCYDYCFRSGVQIHYLTNNTMNADMWAVLAESPVVLNYNNIWNSGVAIYGTVSDSIGNIFANPMYVSDRDFHLQMYSPLIDAGDPNILDVDGTRSDIGCYGGPGGCSYTYLDLAPAIPESIHVDADSADVVIRWPYNTEADFNHYKIYRDTITGFMPSLENCIAEIESSLFVDEDISPSIAYYYRLSSVDNQHNESDYSAEVAVIPNGIEDNSQNILPTYTTIESVYPNPGNAHFTIVYSASNLGPQPPQVSLKIFDIQGRLVRTLVDGRKPPGTYRAIWDGTNDAGQAVSSGVYIGKVSQWGMEAGDFPMKITLVK
jgi:hypothetical protein